MQNLSKYKILFLLFLVLSACRKPESEVTEPFSVTVSHSDGFKVDGKMIREPGFMVKMTGEHALFTADYTINDIPGQKTDLLPGVTNFIGLDNDVDYGKYVLEVTITSQYSGKSVTKTDSLYIKGLPVEVSGTCGNRKTPMSPNPMEIACSQSTMVNVTATPASTPLDYEIRISDDSIISLLKGEKTGRFSGSLEVEIFAGEKEGNASISIVMHNGDEEYVLNQAFVTKKDIQPTEEPSILFTCKADNLHYGESLVNIDINEIETRNFAIGQPTSIKAVISIDDTPYGEDEFLNTSRRLSIQVPQSVYSSLGEHRLSITLQALDVITGQTVSTTENSTFAVYHIPVTDVNFSENNDILVREDDKTITFSPVPGNADIVNASVSSSINLRSSLNGNNITLHSNMLQPSREELTLTLTDAAGQVTEWKKTVLCQKPVSLIFSFDGFSSMILNVTSNQRLTTGMLDADFAVELLGKCDYYVAERDYHNALYSRQMDPVAVNFKTNVVLRKLNDYTIARDFDASKIQEEADKIAQEYYVSDTWYNAPGKGWYKAPVNYYYTPVINKITGMLELDLGSEYQGLLYVGKVFTQPTIENITIDLSAKIK